MTAADLQTGSAIGRSFLNTPRIAVSVATLFVVLDYLSVRANAAGYGDVRICLALVAFAITVGLSGGDHASVGLRLAPVQGWWPWVGTSLKIGGIVGVCVAVGLGVCTALGYQIPIATIHPSAVMTRSVFMCFIAPVVEETLYRFVACGLPAAMIGNKATIAINGVLFGYLHVLYGIPSPENLVGGFFLAWAYLKSETILVPLILHAVGNAIALLAQMAAWYLLVGSP